MKNLLKEIENKIKKNIPIDKINIIDNSEKHKKHKFFDKNRLHLHLNLESKFLKTKDRLTAQRIIYKVLENELKFSIHALEIKIK